MRLAMATQDGLGFWARFTRWLDRGNEPGRTTRRLHTLSAIGSGALIAWLVVFAPLERAKELMDPLLVLHGATLGIYIWGRTAQARPPADAAKPNGAPP